MTALKSHARFVALLALLSVVGCSGPSYDTAEVSGTVTLGGRPLPEARVSFQPMAQGNQQIAPGPGSAATTDAQGRYALRLIDPDQPGAVVGRHRVRITTAREKDPQSDAGGMTEEVVPEKYRDGSLMIDVPPEGNSAADFAIESKPSPSSPRPLAGEGRRGAAG